LKIAITGVAGFLGSHLADEYLAKGHEIVGIDNLIGGYRSNVPEGVDFREIDLLNLDDTRSALREVEIVVQFN
jgi:UDP-glucose 4-epimerase